MNALSWLVLLVLPAFSLAKINVEILASEDESQQHVHTSGSEVNIISDVERETFNLSDVNLKKAVNDYIGAKPDDVFLKSPTPWNDLYKTYGWTQVHRILKPVRAKMLSVKFKPTFIFKQEFRNPSSKVATYQARIRHNVEDTISSMWHINGQLSTGLNISYGFNFMTMAVSGKASMSYTSNWGENVYKSQMVSVGSDTGLEITLQPNQTAKAELFATTGVFIVEIDYEASLDGTIAVNYDAGYRGHHFYGLDINDVLKAGNMSRTVLSSENITLGYYADSDVVVRDVDSDDVFYFPNLV